MSAGSANTDALFDRELKKYDTLKADVAANVARNEELLAAIGRDAQVNSLPGRSSPLLALQMTVITLIVTKVLWLTQGVGHPLRPVCVARERLSSYICMRCGSPSSRSLKQPSAASTEGRHAMLDQLRFSGRDSLVVWCVVA
jgi:hypothetical protein